jgi:hypothetical protein
MPRLTAELFGRWSARVTVVLGHDDELAWLLLADAGTPKGLVRQLSGGLERVDFFGLVRLSEPVDALHERWLGPNLGRRYPAAPHHP